MIEISHLTKKFDQFVAVDDLSFSIREGEVLGFLGPNGAGKSTTMKVITGFLSPSSGRVIIDGHDISSAALEAKRLIGYLPEGAPSYGDMTTLEFLRFIAQVRGFRGDEIGQKVDQVINEVALQTVRDQSIETLSKGFKRRVGLAQAIMHDPKVLILDEPTDGLDPNQKHHVRALIKSLATDKIVIISTHILEEVTAVCSRAVIIANGKIVADGTPSELESQSRFHQAIRVTLTDSHDLVADLATLPGVASVEVEEDNRLAYTIFAEGGASIFSQVSEIAQQKHWPISEFHIERGQLEEVFRSVTQQSEGQTDE
ncbi:MAG: ABC transporter ATP-binding protein [Gammaproteobacteria bacterium]|nr:ABC transporter ATP-binding protein [Gammaproteobacteria bacterium]